MTLKIGDRVRVVSGYMALKPGDTGVVTDVSGWGKEHCSSVRTPDGRTGFPYSHRLEKIEEEPPRPLGLQVGDKVVNLKTGREGLVLKGPVSGELKVYDQKPPIKDAVPAAALEEYEFHYPGTYDVWRRVTESKKAQPW